MKFPCIALGILLVLAGCVSPRSKEVEGPTFDPQAYGTRALIAMLHDPLRSEADALLAAETLKKREMAEADGRFMMQALLTQTSSKVRLEILNGIGEQKLTYLYPDLMAYVPGEEVVQDAVRALDAASAVMRDDRRLHTDLSRLLLEAPRPEVRARAGMQLSKRFPFETEPVFLKALPSETSATVAAMMTEYLAQKGTRASLPVLEEISNAIDRTYSEDNFLGKPFTSDSVRRGAVQAVQRLRRD